MKGTTMARQRSRSAAAATRLRVCFLAVAIILSLFAGRLFQLQGIDSGAYAAMAVEQGSKKVPLPAARGEILDRNGIALAKSVEAVAVTADPSITARHATQIAEVLVGKLDLDYFDTLQRLSQADLRFVYLAHKVPTWKATKVVNALQAAGLSAGVYTERDPLRTYPGDALAANVLGLVGSNGDGAAGLEQTYQSTLAGTDGSATYELSPDEERIPLADSTVTEPVDGTSLRTTLDRDLQWYADRRLSQAVTETGSGWGVAVTMDVQTGQVLQLSQVPTFDANDPASISPSSINARGVQIVYEPGSVQKVMTMAAIADQGLVNPTTKVVVPPSLTIDDFEISDSSDHGTIHLTATGVISKSSNLGTILLAKQLSDSKLHSYLRSFGFGTETEIGLPGESGGILNPPTTWSDANHATIAFGQGISVTAVQMAAAVGTIANGGTYVQPTLVQEFIAPGGQVEAAPAARTHRVVSEGAAAEVIEMMEAVTRDDGTAPLAQIPGYRVAGKTGTAWRVDPETGRYVRGENTVSFVGFAPADEPRFVTYVVLDNPTTDASGGSSAAPVFQDVISMALERYGVPPTGAKAPNTKTEW